MQLILVDPDPAMTDAWTRWITDPEVAIRTCPFEDLDDPFDCLVTAGNGFGLMDGGVDLAVRDHYPGVEAAVQRETAELRGEMHREIAQLGATVHQEIGALRTELHTSARTAMFSLIGAKFTLAGLTWAATAVT